MGHTHRTADGRLGRVSESYVELYSRPASGNPVAAAKTEAALAGDSGSRVALAKLKSTRVAFQGERGAFSEAAAVQLLGESITTLPRSTFDSAFAAISDGDADALLAPVENTLAGSVVRVYDLLLESNLSIVAETILHIEHQLIGCPGATLSDLR